MGLSPCARLRSLSSTAGPPAPRVPCVGWGVTVPGTGRQEGPDPWPDPRAPQPLPPALDWPPVLGPHPGPPAGPRGGMWGGRRAELRADPARSESAQPPPRLSAERPPGSCWRKSDNLPFDIFLLTFKLPAPSRIHFLDCAVGRGLVRSGKPGRARRAGRHCTSNMSNPALSQSAAGRGRMPSSRSS